MTPSLSLPIADRLRYAPGSVSLDELQTALDTLDALQCALDDADLTYSDDAEVVSFDAQIDAKIDAAVAKEAPDHAAYRQFFDDCFAQLGKHYPCPEVTSGYDCSVIFDCIELGDATRDERERNGDPV